TVRAIDLTLADLFAESKQYLFPGNPLEYLGDYQRFTEWSLLVDVARWHNSAQPPQQALGNRWQAFLNRQIPWKMPCQRNLVFEAAEDGRSSIFTRPNYVERDLRAQLPPQLVGVLLKIDLARHIHRPDTRGPSRGQNFLWDPVRGEPRP